MNIMKTKMLYAIVVIVILAIVLVWSVYFSPVGKMMCGPCGCFGDQCGRYTGYYWNCQDTKTYTCPNSTTNYTCSSGTLNCYICSTNYTMKNYNVTLSALANQTINGSAVLAGIFTVNGETVGLSAGQRYTLSDNTIFGVTTLMLNYSAFYLQSAYETKSSSLTAPFPKSTSIALIISQSQGCGVVTNSCTSGYTSSCSGNILTCTKTTQICSSTNPGKCVQTKTKC